MINRHMVWYTAEMKRIHRFFSVFKTGRLILILIRTAMESFKGSMGHGV